MRALGDAAAARLLAREQILQIADRAEHRRVSVEDVVRDTDDLALALRNETMDRFVVIEQAAPSHACDLDRHGGGANALVKGVISVPQDQPLVEIRATLRTTMFVVITSSLVIPLT